MLYFHSRSQIRFGVSIGSPQLGDSFDSLQDTCYEGLVKHLQENTRKPQYHEDRQFCPRDFLIKYCYSCKALPTGAVHFSPFPFLVAVKTLLLPVTPSALWSMQSMEVAEDPQQMDFCAWLWNRRCGEGRSAEQLGKALPANFNISAASSWNKRKWLIP